MRQLRYNYQFPTGFVQPYPLLPFGSLQYPFIYGISQGTPPTIQELAGFQTLSGGNLPQTFTFATTGGYLNILIPLALGVIVDTFQFGSFPVRFNILPGNDPAVLNGDDPTQPCAFFALVNGVPQAYTAYQSEYPQNGTNIVLTTNLGVLTG